LYISPPPPPSPCYKPANYNHTVIHLRRVRVAEASCFVRFRTLQEKRSADRGNAVAAPESLLSQMKTRLSAVNRQPGIPEMPYGHFTLPSRPPTAKTVNCEKSSHVIKTVSREITSVSRETVFISREMKLTSREMKPFSRENEIISREDDLTSRDIKPSSRETEVISRDIRIISREMKIISRAPVLKIRMNSENPIILIP
ncbi:MAG: hypothetical protein LBJ01_00830, partial [Tannerella sp.]|nr:hypothetical protein [Tannerella sp.]